jgi:hypothetical protein
VEFVFEKSRLVVGLKRGDRNIVYLSPFRGSFRASFALGEKAVAAARKSCLPPRILKSIAGVKRYPEGTAVRIEVNDPEDAAIVKMLAAIKLEY